MPGPDPLRDAVNRALYDALSPYDRARVRDGEVSAVEAYEEMILRAWAAQAAIEIAKARQDAARRAEAYDWWDDFMRRLRDE